MKRIFFAALLIGTGGVSADTLVAYWDFGPDPAGYTENVSVENAVGTPTLSGMSTGTGYDSNGQTGTSFVDAAGTSHAAGQALAWGSGVNDGNQEWILSVDLTGYQDLSIRWDQRSSTVYGPTGAVFEYKVGSGSWNLLENISLTQDAAFHDYEKDLSSITAINNQSDVKFRLSGFSGGSGNGTFRIDNLQLSTIPEPAAVGFVILTGLGFFVAHRFFDQ